MSIDELKAGLSRLAEDVVPMENPHGRLLIRRRRRLRNRIVAFATATATIVAGMLVIPGVLIGAAKVDAPVGGTHTILPPGAGLSYVHELVTAPVRGNLSGKDQYVRDAEKDLLRNSPFPETQAKLSRLIFLNQTEEMTQAVAVFVYAEQIVATAAVSKPDHGTGGLALTSAGTYPLAPFTVIRFDLGESQHSVLGLAPPECEVSTSADATLHKDGTWSRQFIPEPTGDYVVRSPGSGNIDELWRVACDGRVREIRPAEDNPRFAATSTGDAARLRERMHERLVGYAGLAKTAKTANIATLWQGAVADFGTGAVVGPKSAPGPATLVLGNSPKAILAVDPAMSMARTAPTPTATPDKDTYALAGLGATTDGGLTFVRMPQRLGDAVALSDRMLVVAGNTVSRVEALDDRYNVIASAPVKEKAAILNVPIGSVWILRPLDSRERAGTPIRVQEPILGARLLGDQLINDWR